MPRPRSLRKQLLLRLLVPLLGLSVIGTTVMCYLAFRFSNDVFDRELSVATLELRHEILETLGADSTVQLGDVIAKEADLLLVDRTNPIVYNVVDGAGAVISGTADLPLPSESAIASSPESDVLFYDAVIDGRPMRVASLRVAPEGSKENAVQILVAEGIHPREVLAGEMLAVAIPQVLLLVVLVVLAVVHGVGGGIRPLNELGERIAARSPNDLGPLDVGAAPVEARYLVSSINHLMQRVKHFSESRQQCAADAAHVMQTPLTGMKAQIELGLRQEISEETRRVFGYVLQGVDRLSHMLRELSVLERNDPVVLTNLELAPIDLCELAQNAATEWVPIALKKGIDLGCAPCPASVVIQADAGRLKNLLDSLLDNAIRYTPSGGRVTIGCDPEQETTLLISDNGTGIPLEERGRVFDRFYRVSGTGAEGSGLGLAIVKEIAELHNATVELGDGPGNVGTEVRVRFPAMAAALASMAA